MSLPPLTPPSRRRGQQIDSLLFFDTPSLSFGKQSEKLFFSFAFRSLIRTLTIVESRRHLNNKNIKSVFLFCIVFDLHYLCRLKEENEYKIHKMKKKIQFSLVYRDMWQSSGKFQPRKDQLERIAPVIIEMGCFARVETNGGAFEQVNLLAGENPNDAVRAFCKPFNEVGIKTHMLDRGLNALRMYPVPDDVRALMYKVKHAQGVDIPRIFDGLNDTRNIIPSIRWAKEAGMTPQATLCITTSPVHTLDYYMAIADEVTKVHAICVRCGALAYVSHRTVAGEKQVMLGEKQEYEPLCRECYRKAIAVRE